MKHCTPAYSEKRSSMVSKRMAFNFVKLERNMFRSGISLGSLHKPRDAKRCTYHTLHSANSTPRDAKRCTRLPHDTTNSTPRDAKRCTRLPCDTTYCTPKASWCLIVHEASWYHILHSTSLVMPNSVLSNLCARCFLVIPHNAVSKPLDAKQCTQQASWY